MVGRKLPSKHDLGAQAGVRTTTGIGRELDQGHCHLALAYDGADTYPGEPTGRAAGRRARGRRPVRRVPDERRVEKLEKSSSVVPGYRTAAGAHPSTTRVTERGPSRLARSPAGAA